MMSWLISLAIGLVTGWLVSYAFRPDRRNYIADIVMGITGSLLATWFFGDILRAGGGLTTRLGEISLLGSIWSILGAIIGVAIIQSAISMGEDRAERMGTTYAQELRRRRRLDEHEDNDRRIE